MLELTVKTLDSQNHAFSVPDEATVRQLKENILEKMGVAVDSQRLIFHGKVLQDDKKLTDYGDVNGKVFHLVQRAPPSADRGNNSASSSGLNNNNVGGSSGSRPTRTAFARHGGSNATYLGAMAFPADLMDAQGMVLPAPSLGLSRGRLNVAQRMLLRATASINTLDQAENGGTSTQQQNSNAEEENAAFTTSTPEELPTATASATTSQDGGGSRDGMYLSEATGSIAQAAQAATAAAIAAAVSAAHAAGVPNITIIDDQPQTSPTSTTATPPAPDLASTAGSAMVDVHIPLPDDHHPEDVVAVEVEIDASNDGAQENDAEAGNFEENNASANERTPGNPRAERTWAFARLLSMLENCQQQFQPLLHRCYQLMVNDPSFSENSSPNAEECQRLFNGVSVTMHHLAHAYHALSDIMVDFNEDTPRTLRCRPILIQHTAILETGFPIQINLSSRRNNANAATQPQQPDNNNERSTPSTPAQPSQQQTTNPLPQPRMHPSVAAMMLGELREVPLSSSSATVGGHAPQPTVASQPQGPANSSSSNGPQAGAEAGASGSTLHSTMPMRPPNPPGFYFPEPENLEIFMDFGPEGVTLGSVETTVIRGRDSALRTALGGGIRTPMEFLQSVQAIQSQRMNRSNQQPGSSQGDGAGATTASNQVPHSTPSPVNDGGTSTQTRSSASESTTSTQTAPRTHLQLGTPIQGLGSTYDQFLPCNSHHIRAPRPRQRSGLNVQAAAPPRQETDSHTHDPFHEDPGMTGGISDLMQLVTQLMSAAQRGNTSMPQGPPGYAATGPPIVPATGPPLVPAVVPPLVPASALAGGATTDVETGWPGWNLRDVSRAASSGGANAGVRRHFFDAIRNPSNPEAPNLFRNNTIADFLNTLAGNSYVEGESIVSDFFMTLARNLTWTDVVELSMARRAGVEAIVTRLRPALQGFVMQRLLQGESITEQSIARGCERMYVEIRPFIDVMQEARLLDSVDLTATINNYNQTQLPGIVSLILDPCINTRGTFAQTMTYRVRKYVRELIAIIIHCCQDGNHGFDTIVQSFVRLVTRGVPAELQQWTEVHSVNNLRSYTASLDVPLEDIERYLVYRMPHTTQETASAQAESRPDRPEPMETDTPQSTVWVSTESLPHSEKTEEPIAEALVAMDTENLPDVLIGSESWHNTLPPDWVPIITRDTQRQRRQGAQKPLSDAYLSSIPSKRRRLIAAAKPHGTLSQVVSDGVRHAIGAAGVNSPIAENVIAEAGRDVALLRAYKEQERMSVSTELRSNPDFSPQQFPNAAKHFNK